MEARMNRALLVALIFYGPMLISGVWVRPPGALHVVSWPRTAAGLLAAAALSAATIAFSHWLVRHTVWGRRMKDEMRAALGVLASADILWLALLSAFGEEFLFRGVLQPRLGPWWSTLLFGAFHFPFRPAMLPWTAFALAIGAILALWPAILLHFCVNYFNLHDIAQA